MVGRNYMFHNSTAVLALSREPNLTMFQKTLSLNDFYFGMEGFNLSHGQYSDGRQVTGPYVPGEKPIETALAPMMLLNDIARHAVDFWLITEDLPKPDNRITVDGQGKIKLNYVRSNQVPQEKLYDKLKSMLNHLGMHPDYLIPRIYTLRPISLLQGWPIKWGLVVLERTLKHPCWIPIAKRMNWTISYVVDTSFFPSIGAVNPSLTAIANALRIGDHLLQRLGTART